jgi:hypothetical protein
LRRPLSGQFVILAMAGLLNYAPPSQSSRGRAVFGWILFAVCFLLSLHIAAISFSIVWGRYHPAHSLESGLIQRALSYILAPLEGMVAAACWWGCWRLRVGWRLSGAAMIVALIAWLCAIISLL